MHINGSLVPRLYPGEPGNEATSMVHGFNWQYSVSVYMVADPTCSRLDSHITCTHTYMYMYIHYSVSQTCICMCIHTHTHVDIQCSTIYGPI